MSRSFRSLFLGCFATGLLALSQGAHALPSACDALASNLVANCGFEAGDFSSWTTVNADPTFSFTSTFGPPHTGLSAASFGNGPDAVATISQTLITTPGTQYTVGFWVAAEGTGDVEGTPVDPANSFDFSWGGVSQLGFTNRDEFAYTFFSFLLDATSASTVLSFSAFDTPSFIDLDDVSVVPVAGPPTTVPEPTSIALLALAGAAAILQGRRRKTGRPG